MECRLCRAATDTLHLVYNHTRRFQIFSRSDHLEEYWYICGRCRKKRSYFTIAIAVLWVCFILWHSVPWASPVLLESTLLERVRPFVVLLFTIVFAIGSTQWDRIWAWFVGRPAILRDPPTSGTPENDFPPGP